MKKLIFTVVCFLLLTVQAQAVELPEDLMDAVPEEAEDLLDGQAVDDAGDLAQGIGGILERLGDRGRCGDPGTAAGCGGRTAGGGFVRSGRGLWPGNRREPSHAFCPW